MFTRNEVTGMYQIREGEIGCLAFHQLDDDGSIYSSMLYQPTREEIIKELKQHGLPVEHTMELIDARDEKVHAIYFELDKFKEYLREKGYRV